MDTKKNVIIDGKNSTAEKIQDELEEKSKNIITIFKNRSEIYDISSSYFYADATNPEETKEAFLKNLAVTYSNFAIRVNCVCPFLTNTKMAKFQTQNELAVKSTIVLNAIKRIGVPIDTTNSISFFLSKQRSFITDQILLVDGGLKQLRIPPKI